MNVRALSFSSKVKLEVQKALFVCSWCKALSEDVCGWRRLESILQFFELVLPPPMRRVGEAQLKELLQGKLVVPWSQMIMWVQTGLHPLPPGTWSWSTTQGLPLMGSQETVPPTELVQAIGKSLKKRY